MVILHVGIWLKKDSLLWVTLYIEKKYTYVQPKSLAAKIAFVNFGSKGKPAICLPNSVKLILVKKRKSGSISVLIAPKSSNCLKAPSTDSLGGGSKKSNFSNFVIPINVKKPHTYYLCL